MSSRERILDAAMDVFSQYGYRRSSMEQVAQQAGLTRQALYHHFETKESLFRAVVEALHEGAFAAEVVAGEQQERAGGGLADIIAAQIDARFRYILDCLASSPHAKELLSEHQLQTRDLYQSFVEHHLSLRVETIDRVCASRGIALQEGITALDLARCIQIGIRGIDALRHDAAALNDLDRMVRLLVAGALAHEPTNQGGSP
jgi:AcrR family transcriptional regulator